MKTIFTPFDFPSPGNTAYNQYNKLYLVSPWTSTMNLTCRPIEF
jgi:hypothetical protein